jgi:hypothetical protein
MNIMNKNEKKGLELEIKIILLDFNIDKNIKGKIIIFFPSSDSLLLTQLGPL